MKTCAIVGATGYTGQELIALLQRHGALRASVLMTARPGVQPEQEGVDALDLGRLADVDGVFLCTPHGAASRVARAALDAGRPVVDLSADFRLRDPALFAATYGDEHPAPDLLGDAVYGLTEHARARVQAAALVANPGCYPTSILLPLLPLLTAGLLAAAAPVIADSKSGVSGAGKAPNERTHFGSVHENFLAYGIGRHRHAPEIAQELGREVVFTPHLLPVFRGILSTIYVQPATGVDADGLRACLRDRYDAEPFVQVMEAGTPELRDVRGTNLCRIAVDASGPLCVITSAIDNLVKGAAGQALQNMNLMLGLEETEGLL